MYADSKLWRLNRKRHGSNYLYFKQDAHFTHTRLAWSKDNRTWHFLSSKCARIIWRSYLWNHFDGQTYFDQQRSQNWKPLREAKSDDNIWQEEILASLAKSSNKCRKKLIKRSDNNFLSSEKFKWLKSSSWNHSERSRCRHGWRYFEIIIRRYCAHFTNTGN